MSYILANLLTETARDYPQQTAVVYGKDTITYKELDEITNRLAWILKDKGVRRGDRVGIYINKSIPSIISIFGILKAGGVYVPLDPNAPESRLSYIIDNCRIRCLLTSSSKLKNVAGILAESTSPEVVILTDDGETNDIRLPLSPIPWSAVTRDGRNDKPENLSIETDLAYIIYTSGSTGTPKGVMISHLNSLTFVNWSWKTFSITAEDRLSSHAPLHFDLSIHDIFAGVKAGATICLVPETLSMFPSRLAGWIAENKITVWYSVPSILSMMVLHGRLDRFAFEHLRTILFAGEVFPIKFLRELMKQIPHAEYYNLYGPTETNVITFYHVATVPPDDRTQPVPIGKACENMDVFALTTEGIPVSGPGEEGELMGRGSCVAMGYWGDPEKTGRGFVRNPLQVHFEEKMYKTGDLVTLDKDGNYIYWGRKDHMIKSRGYRIEIGEIEAAIYAHSDIREAAVIAIPDDVIGNRIKAIVALREEVSMDAARLRMICSEKVPKYMVPEIVEFRDALPKTSTGKIDKPTLLKETLAMEH